MNTALLVDDEHLVLDTLMNYVNWEALSIRVVGTARNGKEAYDKVCTLRPDIILTDIKMPISDGMELATKVRQHFPEIQIVFLSGYNEFEYARSAIGIGVSAYLLKPVDYEELASVIKIVRQKCEKQKSKKIAILPTAREYLRELLQAGNTDQVDLIHHVSSVFAQQLGITEPNPAFYFSILSIDEMPLLSEYMKDAENSNILHTLELAITGISGVSPSLLTKLWDGRWLLACAENNYEELSVWRQTQPSTERWVSCCCLPQTNIHDLIYNWHTILKQRKQIVSAKGPGLILRIESETLAPPKATITPPLPVAALMEAIWNTDREKIQLWMDQFYDHGIPEAGIKQVFADTMGYFEQIQNKIIMPNHKLRKIHAEDTAFMGRLSVVECAQSMKMLITQVIMVLVDELESKKIDRKHILIHEVCQMIETEYATPLSTEILAERVFLSPNYLSTIFKEISGQTILEYLTKTRVKKAEQMLLHTNKKIHDIAMAVGYESPSYFSSIFYKNTGLTPNQYRVATKNSKG